MVVFVVVVVLTNGGRIMTGLDELEIVVFEVIVVLTMTGGRTTTGLDELEGPPDVVLEMTVPFVFTMTVVFWGTMTVVFLWITTGFGSMTVTLTDFRDSPPQSREISAR